MPLSDKGVHDLTTALENLARVCERYDLQGKVQLDTKAGPLLTLNILTLRKNLLTEASREGERRTTIGWMGTSGPDMEAHDY